MNTRIIRKTAILIVLSLPLVANRAGTGQAADLQPGASASQRISEARAAEIALGQAGGGQVVGMKLKQKKHGEAIYSVLVVDGGSRIAVKVDAASGMVVRFDRKAIEKTDYPDKRRADQVWPEPAVTSGKAREIALEKTGGGTIVELVKEFKKNGRVLYDVEVIDAGRKYELEIDAQTGDIVEYQEESSKF